MWIAQYKFYRYKKSPLGYFSWHLYYFSSLNWVFSILFSFLSFFLFFGFSFLSFYDLDIKGKCEDRSDTGQLVEF